MTEPLSNMDPWDASASKKQVQVLYWKLNQPVEVGQETKSGFQVFGPSRACVTMKGLLLEKSWIREYFAWVAKSKKLECSQCVVGEDRSPAEEEDRHDQNQHVDHLEERCYDHDHYVVCICLQLRDILKVEEGEYYKRTSHLPCLSLLVKRTRCFNYLQKRK